MTEPAPLIATPDAPAPTGGGAEWFSGADGARLRAALFPASGTPRGSVVLSPGRTEPLDKYFEVIGELQARGLVVLVHDWRGQGLSARMLPDRLRGHAEGLDPYLSDYHLLLHAFESRLPKPWFQMAHSMGGCLALLALARGETRFAASTLSAPMLGIVKQGPANIMARIVARLAILTGRKDRCLPRGPANPLDQTFEGERLGHDPARFARYAGQLAACPDLGVGNLTWGWLDFAFTATTWLQASKAVTTIETPVLIVGAGEDDRVITADAERVAARIPGARYVEIPHAWHEILMETDDIRSVWWAEFDAFVEPVLPA